MRAIISDCIFSLKPNKNAVWLIGSAQFVVHIFSKRNSFWHRLQMALPKQRKLHTSISKMALFWPFFIYDAKQTQKIVFQIFIHLIRVCGSFNSVLFPIFPGQRNCPFILHCMYILYTLIRATFWPFIKPGLVWISVGRWRFSRWFRR